MHEVILYFSHILFIGIHLTSVLALKLDEQLEIISVDGKFYGIHTHSVNPSLYLVHVLSAKMPRLNETLTRKYE